MPAKKPAARKKPKRRQAAEPTSRWDPALCKAGNHPSTAKVGSVCIACGGAWKR